MLLVIIKLNIFMCVFMCSLELKYLINTIAIESSDYSTTTTTQIKLQKREKKKKKKFTLNTKGPRDICLLDQHRLSNQ